MLVFKGVAPNIIFHMFVLWGGSKTFVNESKDASLAIKFRCVLSKVKRNHTRISQEDLDHNGGGGGLMAV